LAIDGVSVDFEAGQISALVGENGAGKSTLMNVLSGLYRPDGGDILLDGQKVHFRSPRDAIARGIGMVHQHFMLVPSLTVAENVVLGSEPRKGVWLDLAQAEARVVKASQRMGFAVRANARIEDLTVGAQQKVEIIKVLYRGARVVILDEPTAVLTPQESQELFAVMRELAAKDHAVVLISHKLREVLAIAQRIYVMRRGKLVAQVRASETSEAELAALMVGQREAGQQALETTTTPGSPALKIDGIEALGSEGRPVLRGLSLTVRGSEIVGVAGVDGNGQGELAEVLTGLRSFTAGSVEVCGKKLRRASPGEVRRQGVAHVPEDRLLRAIVGPMTVEENVALGRQDQPPFARKGLIDFAGRRERANRLLADFDVRPRDPAARIENLSGGNQQKVVLARELDLNPRLLIVMQPTRGLDISAVATIHDRLRREKLRGAGVLIISLDLEELLALSDRLYVIFEGRVMGELQRSEFDEATIGRMMTGAAAGTAFEARKVPDA
jgi:simple sugar transport system ATP-binding protein